MRCKIIIRVLFFLTLITCYEYSLAQDTYKIGCKYKIKGNTYYPQNYERYEEVGMASWYGSTKLSNKITANGDIFNRNALTAAHRTLPMPSIVRVTNLINGRHLLVKVNDRGPFAKNRIIDLSERAAKILGFHRQGLTKVHIQYLKRATQRLINRTPRYKKRYNKAVSSSTIIIHSVVVSFKHLTVARNYISALRNNNIRNIKLLKRGSFFYVKFRK